MLRIAESGGRELVTTNEIEPCSPTYDQHVDWVLFAMQPEAIILGDVVWAG